MPLRNAVQPRRCGWARKTVLVHQAPQYRAWQAQGSRGCRTTPALFALQGQPLLGPLAQPWGLFSVWRGNPQRMAPVALLLQFFWSHLARRVAAFSRLSFFQRFCTMRRMLEKSSAPLPARLCAAYRLRAKPPRGVAARTAVAFSCARPRSLSIRSVPKPPA